MWWSLEDEDGEMWKTVKYTAIYTALLEGQGLPLKQKEDRIYCRKLLLQ